MATKSELTQRIKKLLDKVKTHKIETPSDLDAQFDKILSFIFSEIDFLDRRITSIEDDKEFQEQRDQEDYEKTIADLEN